MINAQTRMKVGMDYVNKDIHILGFALEHKRATVKQRRIREEDMAQVFTYSSGALYDLRV